jgi:putative ABC transport system ATP-binding protein
MHLLSGLLKPKSGDIFWGEKNIVKLSQGQLDNFRGKTMGIAFQQSFLVRSLTVAENIAAVCFFAGVKFDKKYIAALSEILSVQNLQDKYPSALSGGERQRVCLLRAVAHRPQVVFADEPTANLDDKHTADLINLLFSSAQASGSSIIIVTHDQRIKPYFDKKIALA